MDPNFSPKIINIGGGIENSISLKQLTNWCEERFGANEILSSQENDRWMRLDCDGFISGSKAWRAKIEIYKILDEIADFASSKSNWLSLTSKIMKIEFCDLSLPKDKERKSG